MPDWLAHIAFFAGVLIAAALFALVEIQIEGPNGWAAALPTWRVQRGWIARLAGWVFPGRPLTGYHLYVIAFIAVVAHLPFAFGVPWHLSFQLRALAFILLFWVAEDFLWFVLNPHFGLRRFAPEHIAWHRKAWWWIAPRDYWIATALGLVLYAFSRQEPGVALVAIDPATG